eukprot:3216003-Lingulodinium_polyedra.AAC.1
MLSPLAAFPSSCMLPCTTSTLWCSRWWWQLLVLAITFRLSRCCCCSLLGVLAVLGRKCLNEVLGMSSLLSSVPTGMNSVLSSVPTQLGDT